MSNNRFTSQLSAGDGSGAHQAPKREEPRSARRGSSRLTPGRSRPLATYGDSPFSGESVGEMHWLHGLRLRMLRTFLRSVLIVCIGFLIVGCAEYCKARVLDFQDISGIRLSYGFGLRFNVRCTQYLQSGAGFMWPAPHGFVLGGHKYGYLGRNVGHFAESSLEFGVAPLWHWRFVSDENDGRDYSGYRTFTLGRATMRHRGYWCREMEIVKYADDEPFWFPKRSVFDACYDRRLWDCGLSGHVGVVGVEVDFSVLELADFLLGVFGVDILGDDVAVEVSMPLKQ